MACLKAWEESVDGALALVLLLDQFPRNMFRSDARVFATDAQARAVADRALTRGFDESDRLYAEQPRRGVDRDREGAGRAAGCAH